MPHKIQRVYTDNAGVQFTTNETVDGTGEGNIVGEVIANGATDVPVLGFTADRSQLQSVMLMSTQAVTLKTNNSGTPTDTIALAAGVPKQWSLDLDGLALCPFSADVTALFVSNASGAAATLNIRTQSDPVA